MTTLDRSRNDFLRIALLLGALALAGCGYEQSHYEQVRQRVDNASAVLSSKGGSAVQKHYPQGEAWVVDLSKATIDDEVLQAVKSLGRIAEVNLSGSSITDDQFASIANRETLGYLYKLDISDTAITDRGFVAAAPLPILSDIKLKGSKVTDAGIAEFKQKHPATNPLGLKLKIEK